MPALAARRYVLPSVGDLFTMSLTISSVPHDSVTLISVDGELDLATAGDLSALTIRLIEEGNSRLVFDLSGLTFCDSTGLTVFVRAKNRLDEVGGRISLAAPSPIVQRVLDVSGLLQVFDTRDTVPDALAAAAQAS
jgi:anti-anti-sigma factor